MSDILFIKTSSLGDVIHHMPALTDARRQRPGTVLLDRGGGVCAAGSDSSCGGRRDPGCVTPLAGTAPCVGDVAGDRRVWARAARPLLRACHWHPRASCPRGFFAASQRWGPTL